MIKAQPTGRLAPTPSGHLHLGNVVSFAAAWLSARAVNGKVLLRFEDVDRGRARPEIEASQRDDLLWLGFDWDRETPPQRDRDYLPWLMRIADHVYGCTCARAAIKAKNCTCRDQSQRQGAMRLRLPRRTIHFLDRRFGPQSVDLSTFTDPVLRRSDGLFAYTLAVVADDLVDGVTEVVRGADLLEYTAVQALLWEYFDATPPTWLHGPMILGRDGRKLSKSHGSTEIRALRAAGTPPAEVWRQVFGWLGIDAASLQDAVKTFSPDGGKLGPIQLS